MEKVFQFIVSSIVVTFLLLAVIAFGKWVL